MDLFRNKIKSNLIVHLLFSFFLLVYDVVPREFKRYKRNRKRKMMRDRAFFWSWVSMINMLFHVFYIYIYLSGVGYRFLGIELCDAFFHL